MQLSQYFTLEELTASNTAARLGIDNSPDEKTMIRLTALAKSLDDVRILLGHPVIISSGYRSLALNRAIGSKDTSQHVQGLAADMTCPGFGTPTEVFFAIKESGIHYDQLILEFPHRNGWVHISFSETPRRQCLVYDGKTYTKVA